MMRIRNLQPEREPGKDMPGDLYVVVAIKKHPVFERHEDDLHVQEEIPFTLAALGGTTETVDLQGNLFKLDVPEGTQNGTVLRIEGKGVAHLDREGRGDLYVGIKVITPANLNPRQKELLREFQELELDRIGTNVKNLHDLDRDSRHEAPP